VREVRDIHNRGAIINDASILIAINACRQMACPARLSTKTESGGCTKTGHAAVDGLHTIEKTDS